MGSDPINTAGRRKGCSLASLTSFRGVASSRGYTLIEILVVLAVIGIAIALVRVQFAGGPAQVLEDEARRLALVFELARDQAMTSGCTIVWSRKGDSQRLECRRARSDTLARSDSSATRRDETYAKRPWPSLIGLEQISVAGIAAPRDSPLFFTPSGVNAPFELVLAMDGEHVLVAGDVLGRVKVARPDLQNVTARDLQRGAQR